MHSFTILTILAGATTTTCSPVKAAHAAAHMVLRTPSLKKTPTATVEGTAGPIPAGIQVGAAIALATAAPFAQLAIANMGFQVQDTLSKPPKYLTISIVNKHGAPVSTTHAYNAGGPTAVSGRQGPGTLANGATGTLAVPTGWAGMIAVNLASAGKVTNDVSLIESSFTQPYGFEFAVADVDISYVNGFSVPITCSCNGSVVTGCNRPLFKYGKCPKTAGQNTCVNPTRPYLSATKASPFFAPCEGSAYTFPNDHGGNSFGACQSGQVTCCIGNGCPANPSQPKLRLGGSWGRRVAAEA